MSIGGRLLIVSHAAPPPLIEATEHPGHRFISPAQEFVELQLGDREWLVIIAETHPRPAAGPSGEAVELLDGVLLVQRR